MDEEYATLVAKQIEKNVLPAIQELENRAEETKAKEPQDKHLTDYEREMMRIFGTLYPNRHQRRAYAARARKEIGATK